MKRENEPTYRAISIERDSVPKRSFKPSDLKELLPSPIQLQARADLRDLERRIAAPLPEPCEFRIRVHAMTNSALNPIQPRQRAK